MTDAPHFVPGQQFLLNDAPAEVIQTQVVGDLQSLRASIEDVGVTTGCLDDVDVEHRRAQLDVHSSPNVTELHPAHDVVSARWFDLHTQATRLKLAHEQGKLLSISTATVRLDPYQLACVNWVMQKLRQRALIADFDGIVHRIDPTNV